MKYQGRIQGERRGRPLSLGKFDTPRGYQNNVFSFLKKGCLMSSQESLITIFAIRNTTAVKFYYRPISQFPQSTNIKYHLSEISGSWQLSQWRSQGERWGRTVPRAFWKFGCSLNCLASYSHDLLLLMSSDSDFIF